MLRGESASHSFTMVRPKRYRNFLLQTADLHSIEIPSKAKTFDGYEKNGERYYHIRMEHGYSIEAMKRLARCINVIGIHPSQLLEYTRLRDVKDPEQNKCDKPLDLSQHKKIVQYQCNTCEKWFKWRDSLQRHIATIHSSRVYHCPECIFHANRKDIVRIHMRRKHNPEKLIEDKSNYPLVCKMCGERYRAKSGLQYHIRSKHRGITYKCPTCIKQYTTNTKLQEHIDKGHEKWAYEKRLLEGKKQLDFLVKEQVPVDVMQKEDMENINLYRRFTYQKMDIWGDKNVPL